MKKRSILLIILLIIFISGCLTYSKSEKVKFLGEGDEISLTGYIFSEGSKFCFDSEATDCFPAFSNILSEDMFSTADCIVVVGVDATMSVSDGEKTLFLNSVSVIDEISFCKERT
ncbi:TPA: hypothetical protein H1011_00475 [archaeon]|jgi:hypothetical protein|uniref:Lipoprotein n=1 Tax=Candidatus Undinarchaeum marinum TaxID=2756141 RepID=A0A832V043_9ARCH|nr:hypothetical protein [Candidatus Undinarchaeum marinum]